MDTDIEKYTEIRRVAPPRAVVGEDGGIAVFFQVSIEPDGDWSRYFSDVQDGEIWKQARVFKRVGMFLALDRLLRKTVPAGLPGIEQRITSPDELAATTHAVDAFIRAANERYDAVHMPAERARKEAERRKQEALLAIQAELDRIATELPPPDRV